MDERAFLDAILADPDADAPRLVFADWLQENGRPERAEFIRLQIELANLDVTEPRYFRLRRREQELLNAHRAEWLRPFGDGDAILFTFRRGFVHSALFSSASEFPDRADELLRQFPLRAVHQRVERLAIIQRFIGPALERLSDLSLQLRRADAD